MPGNESIQSVQRAVKVLYAVAGVDGGCSVAQIAAKAGLKLHTAYKFTQTLEREHLLTRKTNPLRFVLGPALNELKTLDDERQLLTVSSKILVRTHARLPQSNLMLLEQSGTTTYQRLCIQINRPGVVIQRREYLVPLYSKASSLLFLAYSTPEEAQKIYAAHPFEPNGRVIWGTQARLEDCLAKTRRVGYCLPDVPDIEGPMFRVAAPVFSSGNEMIAAVGGVLLLTEPAKFQPTLVRLCREAAKEITASLQNNRRDQPD